MIINFLYKNTKMKTSKIGKYKLYRTLGEGSFAKVKCKTKIKTISRRTRNNKAKSCSKDSA